MINGKERIIKGLPYVNKLTIEGVWQVGDYQVILKSIDKSRNESEPLLTISPLTPPVEFIYNSLKVEDSFGRVSLTWENPTRENIILEVFKKMMGNGYLWKISILVY